MAHPNSAEAKQALIDVDPFKGMLISDNSFLNDLSGRSPCTRCGKSRKFFCYTCYVPIKELEGLLPNVELPIDIDIIKHKNEIDGKSTAAHAAILAAHKVRVYTYPDIPNYAEEDNVVLIFPSADAVSVNQLFGDASPVPVEPAVKLKTYGRCATLMKEATSISSIKCGNFNTLPITKAVFIDSTWNQCRGIYKDDRIKKLPCVVLQNRISQFWRHQKGSPRWYLSTIEAVHQFLLEIHLNAWGVHPDYKGIENCFTENCFLQNLPSENINNSTKQYNGQYDNLLFFFCHMYDLIHAYYDHDNLHAYKRRLQ